MSIDLQKIPAFPQSQESLSRQIAILVAVANRLGLYDAADAVRLSAGPLDEPKYGCHVDVEQGVQPDDCVIDEDRHHECIYAKPGMRKEQCKYWRIIKPPTTTEDSTNA